MKTMLKTFYGEIVGSIETKPNGDVTARDFYNGIVGYYDKQRNITKDFYGKIVGQGDLTASLVYQAYNERKEKQKK